MDDHASAKDIELIENRAKQFSDLADEMEHLGHNGDELRRTAAKLRDFAQQETQALHRRHPRTVLGPEMAATLAGGPPGPRECKDRQQIPAWADWLLSK